jgi:iron complex outermembrane receptor protein
MRAHTLRSLPLSFAISLALALSLCAQRAEAMPQDEGSEETELDALVVVGSRRYDRTDTQTQVPVDIIPLQQAAETGAQFDLAQTLQYTAPSFNSTRQTGADGADLIDSAALRGLGSDQTLVLVNGKRRHSTALVNLFGARNRGNTGTDLNTLPLLGIERVEVLRDGAAAQYGSDAIAGVINIALKRRAGCEAVLGIGQYTAGDGDNYLASSYCGIESQSGGVLAVTAEWAGRGRSDRSEPADNPRIIGDSKVDNLTIMLNGENPLADEGAFYYNLGFQNRDASSGAFARGGVGSDDIPSRNSVAMYPNGFVPFIDAGIEDLSGSVGVWSMWGDWRADVSSSYGRNEMFYTIRNTLNASIANLDRLSGGPGMSAREFDAGGFEFSQWSTNFDFSQFFDQYFGGLNIAFGAELRREFYQIRAGEEGSFIDADGAGGGNAGSQGFPGFQPKDETNSSRTSYALYSDFEADLSDQLTATAAIRYEHFSDFGSNLDGKLSAAFRPTETLVVRGSLATGFRAPSLQQRFFSSTFTDFISGEPVDVVLAPSDGAIARAAGIPKLTKEESTSFTLGLTYAPDEAWSFALDAYRIDIDDRIVLTGRFDTSDPDIGSILESLGVGQAQFFINSVDTETQGIDFTASHTTDLANGQLVSYLGINISDTDVTRINTPARLRGREDVLLSERERLFIEEGGPGSKGVLSFDYSRDAWNGNLKLIYFGSQTLGTFSGPPVPNQKYDARASADLSLTYAFSENAKLTFGGANVLDKFPSRQDPNETDNGHVFESVQFGLNGASLYARFWARF